MGAGGCRVACCLSSTMGSRIQQSCLLDLGIEELTGEKDAICSPFMCRV